MYEILFDVPPEPKFWLRPCLAPQILGSRKPHGAGGRGVNDLGGEAHIIRIT